MTLPEVLAELNVPGEVIPIANKVITAKDAVAALGVSAEQIVKSILLILDEEKPLLCILRGSDKIDFNKLRTIYKIKNIRTATPEEVLKHTGYPVGAVPPIVENLDAIADSKIQDYADVYGGGGDTNSLLKISPKDILRFAKIEDFSLLP